jgi:hypothetical protein
VAGVVEKARDVVGVKAVERVFRTFCRVCWDRTADWRCWPVLVESDGRRVREQVERALRAKRGVWAIVWYYLYGVVGDGCRLI